MDERGLVPLPAEKKVVFFSRVSRPTPMFTQLSLHEALLAVPRGQEDTDVDHLSIAEVKNAWNSTSTLSYAFVLCVDTIFIYLC
jgi:hypothetical protein